MLKMRQYTSTDRALIENWPAYPPEYADLDYALRADGWISEFEHKPAAGIYVFAQDSGLIAYTILAGTTPGDAEFRIALHAGYLGKGFGTKITGMTIRQGFTINKLDRLHLIVRTNNERAKHLYLKMGFAYCGECWKRTNGKLVQYQEMELFRHQYQRLCL